VAILALAAALRFWGLGFGLPNTVARPDEGRIVGTAADFTLHRTLNPGFFSYPTLFIYVVGGLYAAGCAGEVAARAVPSMSACTTAWFQDWAPLFLAARAVSALAGVAGVAAIFFIGRRLRASAGVIAAALLAIAFLHVRDSHFAVTDVAMTSMLLLALLLLLRADERPSGRRFAAAGLAMGLAASTKYNAALLAAAALVSQIRAWLDGAVGTRVRHTRLLIVGAGAIVGFLAGTPYAVISRSEFLRDTTHESRHLVEGHAVLLDVGWRYHGLVTLPQGVGWPLFVAGLIGMVWMLATRPRQAAIIFAFPIVYYFVAGRGYTVFVRYMVPIVPFLCLGAGALITTMYAGIERRHRTLARVVAAGLLAFCAGPTALKAVEFDRLLSRTDSRVLATDWVAQHIPSGASILMTGGGLQLWRQGRRLPYDVWWWDVDSQRVTGAGRQRPDWIVVEESPLRHYSFFPEELKPVLEQYTLQRTIRALETDVPHIYDQQDAFYLPLDGFSRVMRPGPNFHIYVRRTAGTEQ
jgi:hypothetical protein